MAKQVPKLNSVECLTCLVLGAIGATVYFMWADIQALWK